MDRRRFLASAGAAAVACAAGGMARADSPADHTLTIAPCTLEIAPGVKVRTVAYEGQVPGPMLRLRQGRPVTIDVVNRSASAEIVHWHGLRTDVRNDGAMEEGSPMIAPGARLRYHLTPEPAGLRWYHTHAPARENLNAGLYTGQFGFLLVEDGREAGGYDQEIFLAVHHWEPSFEAMASAMQGRSENRPSAAGVDVGYRYATINGHCLGAGEPIRVRQGQRVLLRMLNASATENVTLALPGHRFRVVALDGNPVPRPTEVETVTLAAAERVEAEVEMNAPGRWVLGSILPEARRMGLGVVVEYAGARGAPVWAEPKETAWDYGVFASVGAADGATDGVTGGVADKAEKTVELALLDLGPQAGERFDTWAINGETWPKTTPIAVRRGGRYRLVFQNASNDPHPMHLHRHSFEVTQVGAKRMRGLMKDVVNVAPLDTVAVEFVADNPGDSLLHCHMQLHMDYGFMTLVRYVD